MISRGVGSYIILCTYGEGAFFSCLDATMRAFMYTFKRCICLDVTMRAFMYTSDSYESEVMCDILQVRSACISV